MDLLKRRLMMLPKSEPYIRFADPVIAEFCATEFGDGIGLTKRVARKITTTRFVEALENFEQKTDVESFDEFKYFVNVRESGSWMGCTELHSIVLPKSCKLIARQAFEGCVSLTEIDLSRIENLRARAFRNCTNLQMVIDVPRLTNISTTLGAEYEAFRHSGITKVTDLGAISNIGTYNFFAECPNLTEVWLPKTINFIGRGSLYACNSLQTLVVLATTPPELEYVSNFPTIGGAQGRKIYVPYSADHSIINEYKSSGNWTIYAEDIYELNPDGTVPTA